MTEQTLQEELVYQAPQAMADMYTNYCPGCTHGLIHKLIAEAIDELGIQKRTISVAPVGCSVFLNDYFEVETDGETVYEFTVFTRAGIRVFHSSSPRIFWDGRSLSGEELKQGIYYYTIEEVGNETHEQAGTIYLFR